MSIREKLESALSDRYRVEREIGVGGMATVYLAHDLRHDRDVALKLLKPELGAVLGPERFLSEIRVTAKLQHPNLLPLFDSGETEGQLWYVMPFVEGESLRAKMERERQLSVKEAVRITTLVAGALDYAHRHGVIHRDLKPENILLHEDQPLVADFGIALAVSNAGGERVTQTGLSLGTPQYMSPEQATGERGVDARTDIYSLGAVLYEMLAGEPPHTGATVQAIIARLMTDTPRSIRAARPSVPEYVDWAVQKALEKVPADRFETAKEFAETLQGNKPITSSRTAAIPAVGRAESAGRPASRTARLPWILAAIMFVAAVAGLAWGWRATAHMEDGFTARFAVTLPAGTRIYQSPRVGHTVAISPDGKVIAYVRLTPGWGLSERRIDDLESRILPGTDGAVQPFFSPDGRWIGFFVGSVLKKVSVNGGAPVPITDLRALSQGACWMSDGRIVVSLGKKLVIVTSGGGQREFPLSGISGNVRWPVPLDSKNAVLATAWNGSMTSSRLFAYSLDDGHPIDLGLIGTSPLGVIEGRLVYAGPTGSLMAAPFNERKLTTAPGASADVLDLVSVGSTGASEAALSGSGTLVYQTGGGAQQIVLVNSSGQTRVVIPQVRSYNGVRYSPDGKRIAVSVGSITSTDIYLFESSTRTFTRLTTEGSTNDRPEWTPDGRRVLYRSDRTSPVNSIWSQAIDASGPAERVIGGGNADVWEAVVSPDSKTLLFRTGTIASADIFTRALAGDTTSKPFAATSFTELGPRFSPDGHWVAYTSDESGVNQIYVRPFPGPGARVPVSIEGGENPIWSRDGRYLFYAKDQQIIVASVNFTPTFGVSSQRVFFEGDFISNPGHATYDVAPNSNELLMVKPVGGESPLIVAQGWKYELRDRLKGKTGN
jgi:hypothetical protein